MSRLSTDFIGCSVCGGTIKCTPQDLFTPRIFAWIIKHNENHSLLRRILSKFIRFDFYGYNNNI